MFGWVHEWEFVFLPVSHPRPGCQLDQDTSALLHVSELLVRGGRHPASVMCVPSREWSHAHTAWVDVNVAFPCG